MTVNRTEKTASNPVNAARPRPEAGREPQAAKAAVAGDGAKTSGAAAAIAQARPQVVAAIKAALGKGAEGLDFEALEWQPGARFAVVPDKDGQPRTFMVRKAGDGFAVEAAKADAPAPAPAPAAPKAGLSPERQAMLEAAKKRLAAKTDHVEKTAAAVTDGNAVAKGLNSFVNVFTKNQDEMRQARDHAVKLYKSELPGALARYETMVAEAGSDPAKLARAQAFLDGSFAKADLAAKAFDKRAADLKQSNKFWAGTFADVAAGLATLGGVALCMTTFGLPIGAGLIAGAVVGGGAATVGAHALLDNQYDLGKEGLANFLVGGIGAAATTFTAGLGGGALQFGRALLVREGVVGATTGLAGGMASEGANGWQDGWQTRVARNTLIGAGMGMATGGVAARFAAPAATAAGSALKQQAIQVGVSSGVGGAGAGLAATVSEGLDGFQEGWQDRVLQQGAGGAVAGAAYAFAPNLNQRHLAQRGAKLAAQGPVPDAVGQVLGKKLEELGLPVKGKADSDAMIGRMLEDDAMGALMRQTLHDPRYAAHVREALAAYGPEALKLDVKSPEGRAARLQLLTMALHPETRRVLVDAVHREMTADTAALKAHLKANPQDAVYDVVVLGAGPNAVNLANVANDVGTHSVLLAGEFSHFQREGAAFYANSLGGVSKGSTLPKQGESLNVIHGAKVQPSDFGASTYNQAGEIGDAAALGLGQAARGKATDVMIDTRAVATKAIKDANGVRTHYEVTMSDGTVVKAKHLVHAGGLGAKPNLPSDPVTRKTDATTQAIADREVARTQAALDANDPAALRAAKVLTTEQYLTAGNRMDEPGALYRDQDVLVLGAGDGGITPAELTLGLAPDPVYGQTTSQMGGPKSVTMIGEPNLHPRYARLEKLKQVGQFGVVKDTYGVSMREDPKTGRIEVLLQPMKKVDVLENGQPVMKDGKPVQKSVPDGEPYWRSADKVVLATGTTNDADALFPASASGKPFSFRDASSEGIDLQVEPAGPDLPSSVTVARHIKGENIYGLGVGAGMELRKGGFSWLLDHGDRAARFARHLFASAPAEVGLKPKVAAPAAQKQEISGGLLRRAVGGPSEAPIARDAGYRPAGKRGDTSFRLKVKLDEVLTKGFTMPDLTKLRLTVTQKGGNLVLRSPDLDPVSVRKLASAIAADKDFAAYLHDFTGTKPAAFAVDVAPDGRIVGRTLTLAD